MESWLLFALVYPFLYAVVNILDKFLMEKRIRNLYSLCVFNGFLYLISSFIILYFVGFPVLTSKVLFFCILAGVLYGLMGWVYYHMVSHAEISSVIGMVYFYVVFVAIFSFIFLKESLTLLKYGAILLAILGTVVLAIEKTPEKLRLNHVVKLMLLYVVVSGLISVIEKYVLASVSSWQAYALICIPMSIVFILPLFAKSVRKEVSHTSKSFFYILVEQLTAMSAYFVLLKSISLGKVSVVTALGTLQPVYVFVMMILLSVFIPSLLKEVITPKAIFQKIVGIGFVVAGVVILSL